MNPSKESVPSDCGIENHYPSANGYYMGPGHHGDGVDAAMLYEMIENFELLGDDLECETED